MSSYLCRYVDPPRKIKRPALLVKVLIIQVFTKALLTVQCQNDTTICIYVLTSQTF